MPRITGDDLPSEILDNIIECFAMRDWIYSNSENSVQLNKRQLGSCSLTCRYWAQRCRPHIFRSVTLRSLDDFEDLLEFMQTPSLIAPSINDCLDNIRIVLTGQWNMPWLHHIWGKLLPYPRLIEGIDLELRSLHLPRVDGKSTPIAPSSLSTHLPQSIPGPMYNFKLLELVDLHLRSFDDLLRLISDVPNVSELVCKKLSFGDNTVTFATTRSPRRVHGLDSMSISDCGVAEFEVQLLLAVLSLQLRFLRLDQTMWSAIKRWARAFLPAEIPNRTVQACANVLGIIFTGWTGDIERSDENHQLWFQFNHFQPRYKGTFSRVTSVEMTLGRSFDVATAQSCDWATIADSITTMDSIDTVYLNVLGKEVFKWCIQSISSHKELSQVYSASKFQLHYYRHAAIPYIIPRKPTLHATTVLNTSTKQEVDGATVVLDVSQVVDYLLCERGERRTAFLRAVLRDDCAIPPEESHGRTQESNFSNDI